MRWRSVLPTSITLGASLTLAFVIISALTSCAPATPVRRSALIPGAYLPSRIGKPLDRYEVRIIAQVNPVRVAYTRHEMLETLVANVGDPGVFIPRLHIGASLYVSVFKGLEIGGQFHYASFDWADPNVTGVLPFPHWMEKDMFTGGIGIPVLYVRVVERGAVIDSFIIGRDHEKICFVMRVHTVYVLCGQRRIRS